MRTSGLTDDAVGRAIRHSPASHQWVTVTVSNLGSATKLAALAGVPAVDSALAAIIATACREQGVIEACGRAWLVKAYLPAEVPFDEEQYWMLWRNRERVLSLLRCCAAAEGFLQPIRYDAREGEEAAGGAAPPGAPAPAGGARASKVNPRKASLTLPLPVAVALARTIHDRDQAEEASGGDAAATPTSDPWDTFLLGCPEAKRRIRSATISKYVDLPPVPPPCQGVDAHLAILKLRGEAFPGEEEVRQLWRAHPPLAEDGTPVAPEFPKYNQQYVALRDANVKLYFTFKMPQIVTSALDEWFVKEMHPRLPDPDKGGRDGESHEARALRRTRAIHTALESSTPDGSGVVVPKEVGPLTWGPYLLAYGGGVDYYAAAVFRNMAHRYLVQEAPGPDWPTTGGDHLFPPEYSSKRAKSDADRPKSQGAPRQPRTGHPVGHGRAVSSGRGRSGGHASRGAHDTGGAAVTMGARDSARSRPPPAARSRSPPPRPRHDLGSSSGGCDHRTPGRGATLTPRSRDGSPRADHRGGGRFESASSGSTSDYQWRQGGAWSQRASGADRDRAWDGWHAGQGSGSWSSQQYSWWHAGWYGGYGRR